MTVLSLALLLLFVASIGAATAAPAPKPTPKAKLPPYRIVRMILARDNGDGRNGAQVRGFKTTDNPLHCVVQLSQGKPGLKVAFRWYAVNAGGGKNYLIKEDVFVTEDKNRTVGNALRLERPWPPGKYRVTASVQGTKLVTLVDFLIK